MGFGFYYMNTLCNLSVVETLLKYEYIISKYLNFLATCFELQFHALICNISLLRLRSKDSTDYISRQQGYILK